MSKLVVDNSVAVRWFFPDQSTPYSEKVMDTVQCGAAMYVPALWFSEFCNVIERAARSLVIPRGKADGIIARAAMLPVLEARTPNLPEIYSLAKEYRLSGYDATYLAAALALNVPIATADSDLAEAAKSLGLLFL